MNIETIYHKRKPDTTRKIREEFTLKNATVFGGYNLLADFIETKRLETILGECIDIQKAEWSTYDFPFILRYLIDGYILGMERTKHFEILEHENLITEKLKMEKLPDYTTLNKDLKRFKGEGDIKGLKAADIRLVKKRLKHKRDNIVYDFDSTVEILYGEQEGGN
ncbi:MAG: transposase [Thermodesulfovibrionales bacterium]|nr:transposase [Thermodesulfovibrionales bacterium]